MLVRDSIFEKGGLRYRERFGRPGSTPAAGVLIVHGVFEHAGRYGWVIEALARQGYAAWAYDLRGHGQSTGERAWVESFDEFLDDLDRFVERVRSQSPNGRLYLFGHSMGGAIVTLYALLREPDIAGVILSAPALQVGGHVFPLLRKLASVASWLCPRLKIVRMGAKRLSRDPAVIAEFERDPLVHHGKFCVRLGAEILRATRRIETRMESFHLPLLVLHGTGDAVTDPEGSQRLIARAVSPDKTIKLYDGLYHDLLHEPERNQVFADIIQWLDARRPPVPSTDPDA